MAQCSLAGANERHYDRIGVATFPASARASNLQLLDVIALVLPGMLPQSSDYAELADSRQTPAPLLIQAARAMSPPTRRQALRTGYAMKGSE